MTNTDTILTYWEVNIYHEDGRALMLLLCEDNDSFNMTIRKDTSNSILFEIQLLAILDYCIHLISEHRNYNHIEVSLPDNDSKLVMYTTSAKVMCAISHNSPYFNVSR